MNYKWTYEKNKRIREEEIYGDMFTPQLQKTTQSHRTVPHPLNNSNLPLKAKKVNKTKTQKWLEKEKKRLIRDMKSPRSFKSARGINLTSKKSNNLTEIDQLKLQAIEITHNNGIQIIQRSSIKNK